VDQIGRLATIGCTDEEIAAVMRISVDTLGRRKKNPEFAAVLENARGMGKTTLRRLQWHRANQGSDTMCIWLGKQMLGQRDRSELTGAEGGPLSVMLVTGVRRGDETET
jgi:hypothetical protein